MAWMNEYEIDRAVAQMEEHAPELAPYARFLSDWKDTVNSNSDGWAHWQGGSKPASKLSELLNRAGEAIRTGKDLPTEKEFKAALSPIRAAATKHKLEAPELEPAPSAGPSF